MAFSDFAGTTGIKQESEYVDCT